MSVTVYKTTKDTDQKLTKTGDLPWSQAVDDFHKTTVRMVDSHEYQEIKGFGAAFTEAAAYALNALDEERKGAILKKFFHKTEGNNYRFCRTHINSCDFSLENYDYVEELDTTLDSFDMKRDRENILPLIKEARKVAGEDITLFASPWSPPAWMKTNGEMNNGGKLKPEFYQAWAEYFCRYILEMQKEGLPIWGVTIQNEPEAVQIWDSCVFSAEEERDFIKGFLGPQLEKEGLGHIRIYIHDHNRDRAFERGLVILSDPEAARYIAGLGVHWYCNGNFDNLRALKDLFPDKDLIFTEGTQEDGTHHKSWKLGERYAYNIIHDFKNGISAWTDWNLVLDSTGGPNHVYNLCSAPIMIDKRTGEILIENSYYYIGHFSRFLKPGAKRVLVTTTNDDLDVLGAKNPDGTKAVVVLNTTDFPHSFYYKDGDKMIEEHIEPHSIATLVY